MIYIDNAVNLRPQKFADVVGQDKVVKGITNFLLNKNYPNVSAFVGNSGCGKSTLARLTIKTMLCEHPIITEKGIEPCCECGHCKDISEERFHYIKVFNGSDLTADTIRELDTASKYDNILSDYNIFLVEEVQLCKDPSRLLQVVETSAKNTKWFFTSTDRDKFKTSFDKNNKSQERSAMRSRLCLWDIKGLTTEVIAEKLFNLLVQADPNDTLPNTIYDILPLVASNAKSNLRCAINDLSTILNAECYDVEECIKFMNYIDEKKENEVVLQLLFKLPEAIEYIQSAESLESSFAYWKSILSSVMTYAMTRHIDDNPYKDTMNKKMLASGNVGALMKAFIDTHSQCNGYFDSSIFIYNLWQYYSNENSKVHKPIIEPLSQTTEQVQIVKPKPIEKPPVYLEPKKEETKQPIVEQELSEQPVVKKVLKKKIPIRQPVEQPVVEQKPVLKKKIPIRQPVEQPVVEQKPVLKKKKIPIPQQTISLEEYEEKYAPSIKLTPEQEKELFE